MAKIWLYAYIWILMEDLKLLCTKLVYCCDELTILEDGWFLLESFFFPSMLLPSLLSSSRSSSTSFRFVSGCFCDFNVSIAVWVCSLRDVMLMFTLRSIFVLFSFLKRDSFVDFASLYGVGKVLENTINYQYFVSITNFYLDTASLIYFLNYSAYFFYYIIFNKTYRLSFYKLFVWLNRCFNFYW